MLNTGWLRIAENLNSSFPCVFILKQSLQRVVSGEQSTVFCFRIKLMAANERIKKAFYSCSPAFVSVGIVSVYKSCLVHIDYWKGWKIPKHISAHLLKSCHLLSCPPSTFLFQRYHERLLFPFLPHLLWSHLLYSSLNESYYFSFKLWKLYQTCDLSSKTEDTGWLKFSLFLICCLFILKTQYVNRFLALSYRSRFRFCRVT